MPYGLQTLWPDHCIQETPGALICEDLAIPHAELLIRKGFRKEIDSYSAFFENDHLTPTGLSGYLRERSFKRVFCAGLAFDFCVRYSAEDAVSQGFETVVIGDACRAIDLNGSADATRASFRKHGVKLVDNLH
jgi:nicotinamidase/pyrazinamidase